jgi:hypothetical protein
MDFREFKPAFMELVSTRLTNFEIQEGVSIQYF